MVGIGFGSGRLPRRLLPLLRRLLPLGQALAVLVQAEGDGQGEDLGGGPERVDDDQAEDDPVVSRSRSRQRCNILYSMRGVRVRVQQPTCDHWLSKTQSSEFHPTRAG